MNKKYFYTVYKITNVINEKIYIGCHKTKNIKDSYMGSGKYLKISQEKYGIENFEKEILHIFDTLEEMFEKEKEIVDEDFVNRKDTYNLKEGGKNWDYPTALKGRITANKNGADEKALARIKWLRENDSDWELKRKERHLISITEYYKNNPGIFTGRKHSKESKEKMSKSKKGNDSQKGEKNSQYGTGLYMKIDAIHIDERKRFKKGKEAKGFITTKEWKNNKIKERKKEREDSFKNEQNILKKKLLKIKKNNNFSSLRELHEYLTELSLYDKTEESLRKLLK